MGGLRHFAWVAVLAPFTAFGTPTASQIQSTLGLARSAATNTRVASLQLPDPADCAPVLKNTAKIDERLSWARAVEACLEDVEEALKIQALAASTPDARNGVLEVQRKATLGSAQVKEYRAAVQGEKDFIGIKWGVGVGYSHGFDDIVEDAEIANGVVRVKKDLTDQPRVILEFHSYLWCRGKERQDDVPIQRGCGPFAAVATRDDKAVSGVAAGFMYGWKTGTGESSTGFSVGVGVILDSGVKKLEDGFREGQPPPAGATTVLLKEESIASAVLFFTRTF
jgi:hypothetical protein